MGVTPDTPLHIWAVSDGRAGIAAQTLGLAEAIALMRPAEISVRSIAWHPPLGLLPWWLAPSQPWALTDPAMVAPPWPDLWIAAGRATLPLSIAMRRWSKRATFVVQLQAPRAPAALFDLVVPPRHDGLTGPNVLPIMGSVHRVSATRLQDAQTTLNPALQVLPSPRIALLVGGRSKAFDLSPERARQIAEQVRAAVRASGGSILLSCSRRTPPEARTLLEAALAELPGQIWTGQGENPFFSFLAAADILMVTEDSTNMTVEAAATGKPVYVVRMDGGSAKFRRFHADLANYGATRPFEGTLDVWPYAPLAETERVAQAVLVQMAFRG